MNNDSPVALKPDEPGGHDIQMDPGEQLQPPEAASNPRASSPSSGVGQVNRIGGDRSNGDPNADKSDSEAETVVLSGKEEGQDQSSKKAIKLEEASEAERVDRRPDDLPTTKEDSREGITENEARKPSLKRKRAMPEHGNGDDLDGGNSSILSSTASSPVQEAHSSKATDTGSNRSRSSPPFEELAQGEQRRISKSRVGNSNGHVHHRGGKSDRGSEPVNGRKRRDTRSATHYDGPTHRSESPPSRNDNRAQSIHSNIPHSGVSKRRKTPAPLHVERRRRTSEDTHPESDDDSSVHSHNHIHKLTFTENNAMSPAKMVSQKKNRDRSGRTLLARACATDAAEAEKWLKERPQDIDVPDNAGNTPLQIAALSGDTEVVQLLLDHGCEIHSKNIDKDTPLIDAVENGHLEVVKILLKAGLDPRQTNAFGKEPVDLVKADDEDAEEIRAALQASKKEKALLRRPSEDLNRQPSTGSRDVEVAPGGHSGASPVNNARSPPPVGTGARRRTARSQPTDDSLLWVNATPARLRDAAGKGDLTIVDHILKMRPQADTESVLAAARGGHDVVLGLMLAIATHDPDPEPLRSGEYKPAYSTPMLAAIGRGNIAVVNLLLEQPGFDPTRRLFRGMTYFEIAKERQGSEWQEEHDILKEAYDNCKHHGGRKSNNNTPRKVRAKRADSMKSISDPSSSPHDSRKTRKPSTLKEESSDGSKRDSSYKGVAAKYAGETKKQSSPALASDLELEPLGPPKPKPKEGKAGGDRGPLTSKRADSLKPKRRLMSGNDFKTDQDMKRRASMVAESDLPRRKSGDSISSHDDRQRRFSDASESAIKVTSEEPVSTQSELGKKRQRMSVSPQASKSDLAGSADTVKKKKRQRVDSQGNAIDQDRDRSFRSGGHAIVANMIASPTGVTSPSVPKGTAPVAFMGSNVASPVTKSPADLQTHSAMISPVNSIDQTLSLRPDQESLQAQNQIEEGNLRQEALGQELERQALEQEEQASQLEDERRREAEAEDQRKAQAEQEEAERKARLVREEEEARLEAKRQSEEVERQIQLEREQEEARVAKQKRDEEIHQRRIEQERLRKEEQERRRREMEERENLRRMRMQEDEERQRRQSLPNGLRRAAELGPEEARNAKEITKWLPLRTVTTQELDPGCEPQLAEERWIANIQAAPILAIKDLDLSQYTAWTRFPATMNHRGSLWRQIRNAMSQAAPAAFLSPTESFHLDEETRPKFFLLRHVFWIKLSDFMDIVPRHQHLAGLQLKTRAMVLHEFPFGKGGTWDRPGNGEGPVKQEAASPIMNGTMTNGYR